MSISDWSSDVCSSDLHAGVEHFLPQLPNSPSTAAARPIQTAITSPIPAALLHSKIDCLPLGWSIGRRRKSFPSRSEEHTSELQSLMRISYAVFCLKKKNNKKTTKTKITNTQR